MTRKLRTALASIVAVCALGAATSIAHAASPAQTAASYLYWSDWNITSLGRLDLNGAQANPQFVPGSQLAGTPSAYGMAVTDEYLYWCSYDSKKIYRTHRFGPPDTVELLTLADRPSNVAVDDSYIYWAQGDAIGRANLDGSNPDPSFIGPTSINSTPINPRSVAVNDTHIYWGDYGRGAVGRANIDGSNPNYDFIYNPADITFGQVASVALNGGDLYWAEDGTNRRIGRSNLDGSDADFAFVPALIDPPTSLTASEGHVWWGDTAGNIGRVSVAGTGLDTSMYSIAAVIFEGTPPVIGYPRGLGFYAGKARPAVTVVSARRTSIKLKVKCGSSASCEIQLQGHKKGTKLRTASKKVSLGPRKSKTVNLRYSAPLRRAMSERGGQVAIEASNVDSGVFRSLAVRVR